MKKLLFFSLFIVLFACSKPDSKENKGDINENNLVLSKKYVTACEGYQLVKEKLNAEGYDTSAVILINISTDLDDICLSGQNIGRADHWEYIINYKNNNTFNHINFYIGHGNAEISICLFEDYRRLSIEDEVMMEKCMPLCLTKENDSPIFIKKLINSSFLDEIEKLHKNNNDRFYYIVSIHFGFLSSFYFNSDFQIQEGIPYWSVILYCDRDRCKESKGYVLLADDSISKNKIDIVYKKKFMVNEDIEAVTAYECYQLLKEEMAVLCDTSSINLIKVGSPFMINIRSIHPKKYLGRADRWDYVLNYKDKNTNECKYCATRIYYNGIDHFHVYSDEEVKNLFPAKPKFLKLSKKNDSDIIVEKLSQNTNSYSEYFELNYSYLSSNDSIYKKFKEHNISFQKNIPYWVVSAEDRYFNDIYYAVLTDYKLLFAH